jgi:hypothetical protein
VRERKRREGERKNSREKMAVKREKNSNAGKRRR